MTTITSLEVAEMVGREHNDVLKDLRRIISQLGEGTFPQSYFIESTYTNIQNKLQPCFLLTKKGCELYATRMTGAKGTQFAVKYIERFNEMEQQLTLPTNKLELALEAALQHERKIVAIEQDVTYLKNNIHLNRKEKGELSAIIKKRVLEALGGMKSAAYKDSSIRQKTFSAAWNELKNEYGVASYEEIAKVEYEKALFFASNWQPKTSLKVEIQLVNQQTV